MAIVKKKKISWTPAGDADIVAHRVYAVESGIVINPEVTPYVEVLITDPQEIIAPDGFPAGTFSGDTNYTIGMVAVDDVGNLSDVVEISSPFDFIAPSAPTNLVVAAL